MKLKAFEAHFSCGHFAPKNFKNSSVVKKLSPKNRGVGIKLVDTVYMGCKLTTPENSNTGLWVGDCRRLVP